MLLSYPAESMLFLDRADLFWILLVFWQLLTCRFDVVYVIIGELTVVLLLLLSKEVVSCSRRSQPRWFWFLVLVFGFQENTKILEALCVFSSSTVILRQSNTTLVNNLTDWY
jgi:multisubunit Na+/H+ antiporter MnhE subunit